MNACCWQQEGHNLENAFRRQAKMAALQIVQTNLCILILGYTILFLTFYYLLGGKCFCVCMEIGNNIIPKTKIFSSSSRGISTK